jgi:hypothetical protein
MSKLLECRDCGCMVSPRAKSCPQCGRRPRRWGLRMFLTGLIMILFAYLIAGPLFGPIMLGALLASHHDTKDNNVGARADG